MTANGTYIFKEQPFRYRRADLLEKSKAHIESIQSAAKQYKEATNLYREAVEQWMTDNIDTLKRHVSHDSWNGPYIQYQASYEQLAAAGITKPEPPPHRHTNSESIDTLKKLIEVMESADGDYVPQKIADKVNKALGLL